MKFSLLLQVSLAVFLGLILGGLASVDSNFLGVPLVELYGLLHDLLLHAFMLIIVPLVASFIIVRVSNIKKKPKNLAPKIFGAVALTALLAVSVAWAIVSLPKGDIEWPKTFVVPKALEGLSKYSNGSVFDVFRAILLLLIPSNIIEASIQANLLAIVVFSFLFGFSMTQIENQEAADTLRSFFSGSLEILTRLMHLFLRALPIGVFGLVAHFTTISGWTALQKVFFYFTD